jgi:hypothetical protein
MRRRLLGVAVSMVVVLGSGASASAGTITFSMTGVIDATDPALAGVIDVGDTLDLIYSFESTTAARAGSNSTFAVFDALTALSFTVGGYSASSLAAPEIQVDDNPPSPFVDRYGLVSRASDGLSGAGIGAYAIDLFGLRLDDDTNTVFTNALDLPLALNLGDFSSSAFFLFFVDDSGATPVLAVASGTLTSVQTVPEPPHTVFLGLALIAGMAAFRQRF